MLICVWVHMPPRTSAGQLEEGSLMKSCFLFNVWLNLLRESIIKKNLTLSNLCLRKWELNEKAMIIYVSQRGYFENWGAVWKKSGLCLASWIENHVLSEKKLRAQRGQVYTTQMKWNSGENGISIDCRFSKHRPLTISIMEASQIVPSSCAV